MEGEIQDPRETLLQAQASVCCSPFAWAGWSTLAMWPSPTSLWEGTAWADVFLCVPEMAALSRYGQQLQQLNALAGVWDVWAPA